MAAHQFRVFIPVADLPVVGKEYILPQAAAHHIATVLRSRVGEALTVIFNEHSQSYTAIITALKPKVSVKLICEKAALWVPSPVRTMLVPILRGNNSDLAVEKLTELGVTEILLWRADKSLVQLKSAGLLQKKLARWERIAQAAAEQSGRTNTPRILAAEDLEQALVIYNQNRKSNEFFLVCSLRQEVKSLKALGAATCCSIIVGPEGDFSDGELSSLSQTDAIFISLGPWLLRAETAAIAACAAANLLMYKTQSDMNESV